MRFLGVFSPRFRSDIAASFRSAILGVHFRGDFAASFHTFFAVRIEYCSNHSPKQILKNKYPIVGLQSHMLIGFVDSTVSLQMKF